jgi:hypothetical protein
MMLGADEAPVFAPGADWDAVQAQLMAAELGDGLPMVPPTATRIAAMLQGVADPAASLGMMAPLFGELTWEAMAWCCVAAGCVPGELPVVAAAAAAAIEPEFNLLGIQTTTGTPTVAVAVHGPAVGRLGMNAGGNCLGPGNRANACIGRAVRLVLYNIGGGKPQSGDMATMGQPGKYGLCFAEGEHPLFAPLHVRRGLAPQDSAVTVLGVAGTMEVLPDAGASEPEHVLRPILAAMQGARRAADAARLRTSGEQYLLLPPEMADVFVKYGWDLPRMQDWLFRESGDWPIARGPQDIVFILTGGAGVKMTCLSPWGGGTFSVTRKL